MEGDFTRCRELHQKYLQLMDVLFIESNPGPVKWALSVLGLLEPVWRLPLVAPQPSSQQRIQEIMRAAGVLQ
jgi:4-hydroxy-tetrahydrodipicolinate synthase